MDKNEVATMVAESLYAAEQAVDDALLRATAVISTMVEARRMLDLSPVVAETAQARILESIAALGEARRSMVASHGALAQVERRLGLKHGVTAFGPVHKDQEVVEPAKPALRLATA